MLIMLLMPDRVVKVSEVETISIMIVKVFSFVSKKTPFNWQIQVVSVFDQKIEQEI